MPIENPRHTVAGVSVFTGLRCFCGFSLLILLFLSSYKSPMVIACHSMMQMLNHIGRNTPTHSLYVFRSVLSMFRFVLSGVSLCMKCSNKASFTFNCNYSKYWHLFGSNTQQSYSTVKDLQNDIKNISICSVLLLQ